MFGLINGIYFVYETISIMSPNLSIKRSKKNIYKKLSNIFVSLQFLLSIKSIKKERKNNMMQKKIVRVMLITTVLKTYVKNSTHNKYLFKKNNY